MSEKVQQTKAKDSSTFTPVPRGVLQRAAITPVAHGTLQRCSNGVECAECRAKREQREGMLQRAAVNTTSTSVVPPIVHDVLTSYGRPLDASTRSFMEPRFGHDFSGVRIHTDEQAATSARAVHALAYTVGRDVVFGSGQYTPETIAGKRLLAHELTHVVQQGGNENSSHAQYKLELSEPGDDGEREAHKISEEVVKGEHGKLAPVKAFPSGISIAQRVPNGQLQRWQYGTAPAPAGWEIVPGAQKPRVEEAMDIISQSVHNSKNCNRYFEHKCSDGSGPLALVNAFNGANVYFKDVEGDYGDSINGARNIAYTRTSYRTGKFLIASSLLHEMFHTCDPVVDPTDEVTAEKAIEACNIYTPYINSIVPARAAPGSTVTVNGISFGASQGPTDKVEFNGLDAGMADVWKYSPPGTSAGTIQIKVPAAATSGPVVVINNGIRSNEVQFIVL